MKIKQFQQMMSMVAMLVLVAFMTTSCNKSDNDTDGPVPISKEVDFYSVTITSKTSMEECLNLTENSVRINSCHLKFRLT